MTSGPAKNPGVATVPTGSAHKFVLKLDTVRVRVLDHFGEPHKNATCDVDIPSCGQTEKATDDKGWLEIRCPKGTEYVELSVQGVAEAKRRVFLQASWDDDKGTKQRLANLGFFGGEDDENAQSFQRAHGLDTAPEDLQQHLDRIESDYKTLDDPRNPETSALDEQTHDLADPGERT